MTHELQTRIAQLNVLFKSLEKNYDVMAKQLDGLEEQINNVGDLIEEAETELHELLIPQQRAEAAHKRQQARLRVARSLLAELNADTFSVGPLRRHRNTLSGAASATFTDPWSLECVVSVVPSANVTVKIEGQGDDHAMYITWSASCPEVSTIVRRGSKTAPWQVKTPAQRAQLRDHLQTAIPEALLNWARNEQDKAP